MNKIVSLIALVGMATSTSFAQPTLRIAPEVGGTFVTMSQKYNGISREVNFQPGFRVGGVVDISFNNHFSIQPAAFLTANNGTESNYSRSYSTGGGFPASESDQRRYHITYLQIPVYALYKTGSDYYAHFFMGLGPYFGVALGGRYQQKFINTLNGQEIVKRYDGPIAIGDGTGDEIRRLDFGLQATAGYETNIGLYFRLFYGYGLLNTAPQSPLDNAYHQSGGGISIGYFFKMGRR